MKQQVNTIQRDRTLERACDKAILTTLAYRSVFKSGLSFHQLATYLISDEKIDFDLYKKRLNNLIKSKKVGMKKNAYFLVGEKPLSWPKRSKNSKEHLEYMEHALKKLERVKWIKMLAITGSVAAHNAKKEDDVDIFVITEKNRLWLTRLFVVLLLKAMNLYRTDSHSSKKLCPNIFVDESSMEWEKSKRSVYVAHEILMMHPIINKDDTYFKFVKKNDWVFDYFSNYNMHLPKRVHLKGSYESALVDFAEKILMKAQIWFMKRRQTTEITTKRLIHFNKMDHSEGILEKFHHALSHH